MDLRGLTVAYTGSSTPMNELAVPNEVPSLNETQGRPYLQQYCVAHSLLINIHQVLSIYTVADGP